MAYSVLEMEEAPAWELAKENAQPLKHGRDARKLNEIFAERDAGRDAKLDEQRR